MSMKALARRRRRVRLEMTGVPSGWFVWGRTHSRIAASTTGLAIAGVAVVSPAVGIRPDVDHRRPAGYPGQRPHRNRASVRGPPQVGDDESGHAVITAVMAGLYWSSECPGNSVNTLTLSLAWNSSNPLTMGYGSP
jgi:hypothetical protein